MWEMAHVRLYIDPKSVQICKKLAKNRVTIGFTRDYWQNAQIIKIGRDTADFPLKISSV